MQPAKGEPGALSDAGLTQSEISQKTGVSREIEREQIRREVEREMLSMTAQQKLERVIQQEKGRLAAMFSSDVNARVKEFLENTIGPQMQKEQREAQWMMRSRKGVM